MCRELIHYYEILINEIEKLPKQRVFKVREILGAEKWREIDNIKDKMDLGKYFYDQVESGNIKFVKANEKKAEQGVQSYTRI